MQQLHIETVTAENVDELGFFCIGSKKHPGYVSKRTWLKKRFEEGLRLKLLHTTEGKPAGFIEYVPGAHTWRTVQNAEQYLVIHCIWIHAKLYGGQRGATMLVEETLCDARENGFAGVAVVTSDGRWMAKKSLFVKNGFAVADTAPPGYQLLLIRTGDVNGEEDAKPEGGNSVKPGKGEPHFPIDWQERLAQFEGLHILYTMQCPYTGKIIRELPDVARRHDIVLNLWEIDDPAEAREIMPSPYGTFALIHNGRLLEDHPVSTTRFRNILQRDLQLTESSL